MRGYIFLGVLGLGWMAVNENSKRSGLLPLVWDTSVCVFKWGWTMCTW